MKNLEVTKETAERWFKGYNQELKNIAIQLYPELEKKELPKTWEELGEVKGCFIDKNSKIHKSHTNTWCNSYKNTFATEEQAEASIALAQLSQLREVYRNGWVPDWTDENTKHCIQIISNRITLTAQKSINDFISFQDAETRDLFLENFRDLIEKAKPLLS